MLGQMMTKPLLISGLIEHAARWHGATPVVSVETAGGVSRTTWAEVAANARRLASALARRGYPQGTRFGTIAWNNRRHLELYFGLSSAGYVCHTINPRLFPDQHVYIINHADDRLLFVDATFLPLVAALRPALTALEGVVVLGPRDDAAAERMPGLMFLDEMLAEGDPGHAWPDLDENTASSLCYTSGTTGHPKGVLYSHRSTLLHSYAAALPDSLGLAARDTVLPVVPMFHVNAWGVPYAAAMVGAKLVLPGPGLDGASLVGLIEAEAVSVALGVPTIWHGLLAAAQAAGARLDSLQRTVIGGSACPPSMIAAFRDRHGVETIHAWGMTETSPLGSANHPLAAHAALPAAAQAARRESQGRPIFGIDLRLVDAAGAELPRDGRAQGELQARGSWVLDSYFRADDEALTADGWFATGDIATIDAEGYVSIRDRAKDIIKSGGEWISSVELEGIAIAHPALADAAVVGVPHPKWDERPILVAVARAGAAPDPADLLAFFDGKVAAWQKPDAVVFVEALPRNATGKVLKRQLREAHAGILRPAAG
jgi:fatty-acyl-CoA synthase